MQTLRNRDEIASRKVKVKRSERAPEDFTQPEEAQSLPTARRTRTIIFFLLNHREKAMREKLHKASRQ